MSGRTKSELQKLDLGKISEEGPRLKQSTEGEGKKKRGYLGGGCIAGIRAQQEQQKN